ncbi:serine/threonine-protein kinase VRK1 [Procambarus clarkii]|uniref:serine/threonine-protein kinase VRK1 n=1 Tax=Procambarus clarkii TaxID=6728 RepID=UPI001E67247D|nr:serine/threonine-protein kinase VRK1-like [Procambarus clarkii]XP_045601483.1 serine/threonine-protein kinase VRK1-like [Procambarus clarkii]XP_045601484.1 serine/threonine-protein kinase VRK1-like [Procambarus clarkii]XP_045601485.1 serine/threonine-protein kinase VRK1-like [Procambarus clarkii]XP_045601486.1 serine/threonine-protein kinase VRK1-like [Procambarus clarkii]XP_045601487.1 serine/threonine-protein kinase VRK1-like [Procambarus clarkii]XP_045601489.1 serine/threonine-protein k
MAPRKGGATNKSGSKGAPKKRVAANGFKLPDPIAPGVIITDVVKKRWKIGHSIGVGGFGEIYLASDDVDKPVSNSADYVIKVEPHSNGPLFAEMHCYMRVARPEHIETWKRERKLKRLGMPKFLGSGSFEYNSQKFRFMVMERFGCDLQKILEQHSKRFSFKTVYQVGIQILDVLEYIHSKEYIHADIKASNLLIGYKPGTENQVFLVDFGLACRYANDGKHKEYKYDQRKAHDGTIEFTSRDAHIGAHSRRGDLEILGYNMTQWLCSCLPWEDKLQDCNYVFAQKRGFMEDVSSFISRCFPDTKPPGLGDYLEYVVNLAFDEQPDYEKCRNILREGLKARGYRDDGKLVFMSATPVPPKKTKSRIDRKKTTKRRSEEEENIGEFTPKKLKRNSNISPCRPRNKRVNTRTCPRSSLVGISLSKPCQPEFPPVDTEDIMIEKENQKMAARKQKQRPRRLAIVKDTSLDNPTPQMIEIMNKIREKSASPPICQKRHRHNSNCYSNRSSPTNEDIPSQFTPEMEAVMRKRAERLSSSESEMDSYSSSSSDVGSPQRFDSSESEDSNDATVYYSPPVSPSYVAHQNNTARNVRGNTRRKGTMPISSREVAALYVTVPAEVRTIGTQTSPGVRVTRSVSRQTSPELF